MMFSGMLRVGLQEILLLAEILSCNKGMLSLLILNRILNIGVSVLFECMLQCAALLFLERLGCSNAFIL